MTVFLNSLPVLHNFYLLVLKRRMMRPKEILEKWLDAFNKADIDGLAALYHENAVNHQVANDPVNGKAAIRQMFKDEFGKADMVCLVENIFEDGEWAILE